MPCVIMLNASMMSVIMLNGSMVSVVRRKLIIPAEKIKNIYNLRPGNPYTKMHQEALMERKCLSFMEENICFKLP